MKELKRYIPERRESSRSRKSLGLRVLLLVIIAAIVYLWRPLFHGLIYSTVYSPFLLIFVGGCAIVGVALFLYGGMSIEDKVTVFAILAVVLLLVGGAYGLTAGLFADKDIAQRTMADSEEMDSFPNANEQNARVLPRDVADVQTRGSVSYRTHRLGESDIARMENGRLAWSYAVEPDSVRNKAFKNQRGVVMTDMTKIDNRQIQVSDETEFVHGEGMYLHRGAEWNLKKGDYNAAYIDDPVEFTHEGKPYMAYPKTGHEWKLSPIPHTVPVWKGTALVHPDGTIEHLSPKEARESEILEGQRLYPLHNTRVEMESLAYRDGIRNTLPGGEHDHVEVAGMPDGSENGQPFVIDLQGEKLVYVTAMEPYGEDTRGLDEVWMVDAETGKPYYYGTGGDTLTGPERAMGIVRSSDTQTGWGDDFKVVEPVPVTINGELWWHSKVVPTDNTDVSRNVFVNAHTGEAVEVHDDQAITEFLAGGNPEEVEKVEKESAENEPSIAYYVVVIGEDGSELDRIPIEEGQDVNIVQGNESSE